MDSNFLEKFVSRLSRREIRDLIWYAQRNGGKPKYIKLLQAIKKQLSGKCQNVAESAGIKGSEIHLYRSYLKKTIFKAIPHIQPEQDEIHALLAQALFLKQKGMDSESCDLFEAAVQRSVETESFVHWMKLDQHSRTILNMPIEKAFDIDTRRNEKVIEYLQLKNIRMQLANGLTELETPGLKISLVDSIEKGSLSKFRVENLSTVKSHAEFHVINRIISIYRKEYEKALFHSTNYIQLRESNPEKFDDQREGYLHELGLSANLYFQKGSLLDAYRYFEKIDAFSTPIPQLEAKKLWSSTMVQLNIAIEQGNPELGNPLIEKLLSRCDDLRTYLTPHQFQWVMYLIALFLTMGHHLTKAESVIQDILNNTKAKLRGNGWEYARILLLIVLFESGKMEALETLLDQISTYYSNNPTQLRFFRKVLRTFDRFLSFDHVPDSVYQEEFAAYASLLDDPIQARSLQYIDFPKWLLARKEKKTWLEMAQMEFEKNRSVNNSGTKPESKTG